MNVTSSIAALFLAAFAACGAAQDITHSTVGVAGTPQATASSAAASANQNSAPERVTLVLKNSLTSKSSHEGAEIKATTRKPLTLPGGKELPRGSLIVGHVVQVSQHSKAKPNGAMMLIFDQVRGKDGASIPVTVTILSLADSADSANESVALPGVRVGGAANSGGTAVLAQDMNDHTRGLYSNVKQSGLSGVFLKDVQGESGVVFAAGEDVFLDAGIQMVVEIESVPAKGQ